MKNLYRLVVFGFVLLSLNSCVKDKFDLNNMGTNQWNPDIAAPVINSSVSMLDVTKKVDSQQWQVDPDNLVSLIYVNKLFSRRAHELIQINNQDTSSTFNWSIPGSLPSGDSVANTLIYDMSLNVGSNYIVDTFVFKTGDLQFRLESDLNHDAKVELTIPGLEKDGNPFYTVMPLNYSGSLPQSASKTLDISGYTANFTHSGQSNLLTATVKITVYGDSNPNNSPYYLDIGSTISAINFKKIYGYFDQFTFNLDTDSVYIDLFYNQVGNFSLKSPSINLQFLNSFGMPILVNINELKTYRDPDEVNLTKASGAPLDDILLGYPGLNQVGDVVATERLFDRTNSNIVDAFAIEPEYVIYGVDGISNPSGSTYNFALDTSVMTVNAIAEIPLHGIAAGYALKDTVDFDISDGFGEDAELESLELQAYMKNGFPIDAKVQVYFTDTNMVVLDSLFNGKENMLMAADAGPAPEYKVTVPVEKWTYIVKQKQSIDNIMDAKRAIIDVDVSTADDGNSVVKVYSDYTVDVKVGVKAVINAEF